MNEEDLYFGFYIDSKGHAYTWGKSCNTKKYVFEFKEKTDSSKVDFKKINTAINDCKNVRVLVIQLLIDSSISSRGHHYNMLDLNWKHVVC